MRGGYNINAVTIERYVKGEDNVYSLMETWHEATSPRTHLHTNCGHKHATLEEAYECIPAVEKAYREKRWPKKQAKEQA